MGRYYNPNGLKVRSTDNFEKVGKRERDKIE